MSKRIYIILFIIVVATVFRFYKFQEWFTFGMDQEYEALIVKNIVTLKHFPLIGVNASDTGLYLGPFFIYFTALFSILTKQNVLAWGLFASGMGIVVTYLLYKIGRNMFTERIGLMSALIYGSSFLIAFYDRQFWNPMPIPFFSLLIGFFLYKVLLRNSIYLIPLFFVFGLAIQSHLSMLLFIPLIVYVLLKQRDVLSKKTLAIAIFLFLILQSPLILFDIRHNFPNTKAFVNLLANKTRIVQATTLNDRISLFSSLSGRFLWLPAYADLFLESGQCKEFSHFRKNAYVEYIVASFVLMMIFIFLAFKRKSVYSQYSRLQRHRGVGFEIILAILILTACFIFFYTRLIFEYYFLYLFPWCALIFGVSLDYLLTKPHGKIVVSAVLVLFLFLNFFSLFTSKYSYSFSDKKNAIQFVKANVNSHSYSLEALGECPRYGGYRYLFEHYVGTPVSSYMDSYFKWLYPEKVTGERSERIVLLSLIDERDSPDAIERWQSEKLKFLLQNTIIAQDRFGKIQIYILEPKT